MANSLNLFIDLPDLSLPTKTPKEPIIESIESSSKHYIGYSSDLRQRLLDHNAGKCSSTAKYRPWKLIQYTAFESVDRALVFEKYLKSGSGHAFAKRHFFDKK